MPKIKIQCPAKINYSLKIVRKRTDGFHDIESVMQTISLYDYLLINIEESNTNQIYLSGSSEEIPYDESNLVYKAAKLFIDSLNTDKCYEINIFIEKNIPVAAGLAGGSTDAAGTFYGLNKLLDEPFNRNELHKFCSSLGSDLNFCLEGGTQMTTGRGEILTPQKYKVQNISLIKPLNLGISAKEAYTKFSKRYLEGDINRDEFANDLEWAILNDYPELQHIKYKYPNSIMSGSGATYFVIDDNFKTEHGYWVCNNLKTTSVGVTEVVW